MIFQPKSWSWKTSSHDIDRWYHLTPVFRRLTRLSSTDEYSNLTRSSCGLGVLNGCKTVMSSSRVRSTFFQRLHHLIAAFLTGTAITRRVFDGNIPSSIDSSRLEKIQNLDYQELQPRLKAILDVHEEDARLVDSLETRIASLVGRHVAYVSRTDFPFA